MSYPPGCLRDLAFDPVDVEIRCLRVALEYADLRDALADTLDLEYAVRRLASASDLIPLEYLLECIFHHRAEILASLQQNALRFAYGEVILDLFAGIPASFDEGL